MSGRRKKKSHDNQRRDPNAAPTHNSPRTGQRGTFETMKRILPLLGLLFAALLCSAAENPGAEPERPTRGAKLVLRSGMELVDWSLMSETATTVTIKHKNGAKYGATKVAKTDLPSSLAAFYPVDEDAIEKARTDADKKSADRAELLQQIAQLKQENAQLREDLRAALNPVVTPGSVAVEAQRRRAAEAAAAVATGDDLVQAIRARAEDHYKDGRRNGSGQTLVFDLRITLEPVVEKPGWPGRYTCTGTVAYSLYDSVWGGSFTSRTGSFSCEVQRGAPGYAKVTEFRER